MVTFGDTHEQALNQVRGLGGVAVSFAPRDQSSAYSAATDTFATPVAHDVVNGLAIEVRANEAEMAYAPAGLVVTRRCVLLFVPDGFGDLPEIGSATEWAGETFTVAERFPLRPGGVAILSRVLVVQ